MATNHIAAHIAAHQKRKRTVRVVCTSAVFHQPISCLNFIFHLVISLQELLSEEHLNWFIDSSSTSIMFQRVAASAHNVSICNAVYSAAM
jgi:hypothetical protein